MQQLIEPAAGRALRDAEIADHREMLEVYASIIAAAEPAHHLAPPSLAQLTDWLASAIHPPFVLTEEGQLLGWGVLRRFHPRAAYAPTGEAYLCVAPSSRRSRCGSALLGAALAGAQELGLTSLACMVWGEPWLEAWLKSQGFELAGAVDVDLPQPAVQAVRILQCFVCAIEP